MKIDEEVTAEEIQVLRDILGALTAREVADIMHVSRATLYNWMKTGIPKTNRAGIRNYKIILDYIEQHGAANLMRGRIVPLSQVAQKVTLRCKAMNLKAKRYVRCTRRKAVGEQFCARHLRLLKQGKKIMTVEGHIAEIGVEPAGVLNLPERCIALGLGGYRCDYVGELEGGLCERHLEELRSEGQIRVMIDGLVQILRQEPDNDETTDHQGAETLLREHQMGEVRSQH